MFYGLPTDELSLHFARAGSKVREQKGHHMPIKATRSSAPPVDEDEVDNEPSDDGSDDGSSQPAGKKPAKPTPKPTTKAATPEASDKGSSTRWSGLSKEALLAIRVLGCGVSDTATATIACEGTAVRLKEWHCPKDIADALGTTERVVKDYLATIWNGSGKKKNPDRANLERVITTARDKNKTSLGDKSPADALIEALLKSTPERISRQFATEWKVRTSADRTLKAVMDEEKRFREKRKTEKAKKAAPACTASATTTAAPAPAPTVIVKNEGIKFWQVALLMVGTVILTIVVMSVMGR